MHFPLAIVIFLPIEMIVSLDYKLLKEKNVFSASLVFPTSAYVPYVEHVDKRLP